MKLNFLSRKSKVYLYKRNLEIKLRIRRFFHIPWFIWIKGFGAFDVTKVYFVGQISTVSHYQSNLKQCVINVDGGTITTSAGEEKSNSLVIAAQRHLLRYL